MIGLFATLFASRSGTNSPCSASPARGDADPLATAPGDCFPHDLVHGPSPFDGGDSCGLVAVSPGKGGRFTA